MRSKILTFVLAVSMLLAPLTITSYANDDPKATGFDSGCVMQEMTEDLSMLICNIVTYNYAKDNIVADNYSIPAKKINAKLTLSQGSSIQDEFKVIPYVQNETLGYLTTKNVNNYKVEIVKNDNRELEFNLYNFGKASALANPRILDDYSNMNDENDRISFGIVYRKEELKSPITYSMPITVDGVVDELTTSEGNIPYSRIDDEQYIDNIDNTIGAVLINAAKSFDVPALKDYDLSVPSKEAIEKMIAKEKGEAVDEAEENDTEDKKDTEEIVDEPSNEDKETTEDNNSEENKEKDDKKDVKNSKDENTDEADKKIAIANSVFKGQGNFKFIMFALGVVAIVGIGLIMISRNKKNKETADKKEGEKPNK